MSHEEYFGTNICCLLILPFFLFQVAEYEASWRTCGFKSGFCSDTKESTPCEGWKKCWSGIHCQRWYWQHIYHLCVKNNSADKLLLDQIKSYLWVDVGEMLHLCCVWLLLDKVKSHNATLIKLSDLCVLCNYNQIHTCKTHLHLEKCVSVFHVFLEEMWYWALCCYIGEAKFSQVPPYRFSKILTVRLYFWLLGTQIWLKFSIKKGRGVQLTCGILFFLSFHFVGLGKTDARKNCLK